MDPATRLVCLAITKYVNAHSLTSFVSQQRLAEATNLSERSVRTHVERAVAAGWLTISRKRRGRDWTLLNYTLCLPPVAANPAGASADRAPENVSAARDACIDAPAISAPAPANPARAPEIHAVAPEKKRSDDRQDLPPIQEEGSRNGTLTGSRGVTRPRVDEGPKEGTRERVRKAVLTLKATPDIGIAKLQSMYALSREQLDTVIAQCRTA